MGLLSKSRATAKGHLLSFTSQPPQGGTEGGGGGALPTGGSFPSLLLPSPHPTLHLPLSRLHPPHPLPSSVPSVAPPQSSPPCFQSSQPLLMDEYKTNRLFALPSPAIHQSGPPARAEDRRTDWRRQTGGQQREATQCAKLAARRPMAWPLGSLELLSPFFPCLLSPKLAEVSGEPCVALEATGRRGAL